MALKARNTGDSGLYIAALSGIRGLPAMHGSKAAALIKNGFPAVKSEGTPKAPKQK